MTHRRLELLAHLVPLIAGSVSLVAGSVSLVARAVSGVSCLISQFADPVTPLPGPIARIPDTVTHVRCPVTLVTDLVPLVTHAVPLVPCGVPASPGPVPLVRHPVPSITGQIPLVADLVTPVGDLVALLCSIPAGIADRQMCLRGRCCVAGTITLLVCDTLDRGLDPHLSGSIALLGGLIPLSVDSETLLVSKLASLVHEVAFITGLGAFPLSLITLVRGRWSAVVTAIVAHESASCSSSD